MSTTMMSNELFGMLNVLRTGNPVVDMMLAMLIPYLISVSRDVYKQHLSPLLQYMFKHFASNLPLTQYTTRVVYNNCRSRSCASENNWIVCQAIKKKLSSDKKMREANNAQYLFLMKETETSIIASGSVVEIATKSDFSNIPVNNEWVYLENDISIMMNVADITTKEGTVVRQSETITLRSTRGSLHIDNYITKIVCDYTEEIRVYTNECANQRKLYILSLSSNNTTLAMSASEYQLNDRKTFDNIYFPEKNTVLQVVSNFTNKTGRYGIPGYANKLGFLLYGEPGTGKTSFIKALSCLTNRSIVMVSLSLFKTNKALVDLLYNPSFYIRNVNRTAIFSLKSVIFVFEDIDCCNNIVLRRDESVDQMKLSASDDDEVIQIKNGKVVRPIVDDDKLTLAGILNALDGIMEAEGRMVIMTTNHPDKIDPALIRPGRIDVKLNLTFCTTETVCHLIVQYYGSCSPEVRDRVKLVIDKGLEVTPAKVEMIAVDCDNDIAFIDKLEKRN